MKDTSDYSLLDGYVNGIVMSALEGLATRNVESRKCPECGQPIYSISNAVREYISNNLDENLVGQAMNLYNKRSQLFHKNRINLYEYTGISWPLLMTLKEDQKDETIKLSSCKVRQSFTKYTNFGSYVVFIDYVNYFIRKELDIYFNK